MSWTFRFARIAGIDINIHLTFLLLLPFGAMLWGGRYGVEGALFGMLMIILLFTCVTLHELGHALAARAVGIPVKEIQLLPIGGLAVLSKPITRPLDELLIAIAGPFVNVVLAIGLAVLAAGVGLFNGLAPQQIIDMIGQPSLQGAVLWLIQANILLLLFNLIPAFPMDGGRILRAGLALATGMQRATVVASAVGQGLAVMMGMWGVMSGNLMLVAGAVFIFLGARQEAMAAEAMGLLSKLRVTDALVRYGPTLEIGQRLTDAEEMMLAARRSALPVLQGERLLGIVTQDQVSAARATGRADAWVTAAMRRDIARVGLDETLDGVQRLMVERQTPVVAVYDGDHFLGLLAVDDVRAAFARGTPPAGPQQPQTASGASGAD